MSTTVVGRKGGSSRTDIADGGLGLLRQSIVREHGFEPLRVEGVIPAGLRGTLFRNGPGLYELFNRPYHHMFEGDGAVSGVRLADGKAWGAVKVVQSAGLLKEQRAGKALYGFNAPWFRRFWNFHTDGGFKNTANTSVISWQDRLFALMEAGKPTEVSMEDLSTIGETDLGVIPQSFSAHPHEVPARKALYNFGLRYGKDPCLDLFELPYTGNARMLGSVPLPFPVMLHDFMATEKHLIFLISPVRLNVWRALLAMGPFDKLFQWSPSEGTMVLVVPIDDVDAYVQFQTDSFYQWHFANAVEKNGVIHVDYAEYKDFGSLDQLRSEASESELSERKVPEAENRFVRAIIDPSAKTLQREVLWDQGCEFPRVHPDLQAKEYQYVWLTSLGNKSETLGYGADAIVSLDVKSGKAQEFHLDQRQTTSEPVFVPRDGSTDGRDGWVLSYIYNPDALASYMAIFDGQKLEDGPIAKVWFENHIPTTFHGTWVPAKG